MLDGYIGSDKYTSVWCLGVCNPWGNVWTWVFGAAVLHDESTAKAYAYVNFDDYDPTTGNYLTSNSTDTWETQNARLLDHNYSRLSYNIPTANGWYRYMGVSAVDSNNGIQSLIGLPSADSSTGGSASAGLTDYLWVNHVGVSTFGIFRGGTTSDPTNAGVGAFYAAHLITRVNMANGFRSMLIG